MWGGAFKSPLRPLLPARVATHADASLVAGRHRTRDAELLRREHWLREVDPTVGGARHSKHVSEVSPEGEIRSTGIEPAGPVPRMLA